MDAVVAHQRRFASLHSSVHEKRLLNSRHIAAPARTVL